METAFMNVFGLMGLCITIILCIVGYFLQEKGCGEAGGIVTIATPLTGVLLAVIFDDSRFFIGWFELYTLAGIIAVCLTSFVLDQAEEEPRFHSGRYTHRHEDYDG